MGECSQVWVFVEGFSCDRPASAPAPAPAPCNRPYKRRRALSDVDGEGNEGRKKRRLRLHLITSRFSRPFSQPASNIANRGVNKIPVWGTKNIARGRNLIRKAAIMNRARRRMDAAQEFLREEQENIRERLPLREVLIQKPRCLDVPLPPSPLGLSVYEAFDSEDEEASEDWNVDVDRDSAIYSDFRIMNPFREGNEDMDDYLAALDGIRPQDMPETLPGTTRGDR
ncbi:hypothetical protein PZA11_003193 [Diplocarpon coronariae]